ncbi:MAG: hypothetical protein AB7P52_03950 [Alphaproteobacteria bacterium]
MDAFVIGFIGFVLGMVATAAVVAFAPREKEEKLVKAEDWEIQMAASSLM